LSRTSQTILIDGRDLALPDATGIGTYARTLAETARQLGYRTHALIGSSAWYDSKDPQLSEIAFFDPLIAEHPSLRIRKELLLAQCFGMPFGVRPATFPRFSSVISPGSNALREFDKIYGAPNLFELARLHFRRHSRLMSVKVDEPPTIFHATHPTPMRVTGSPNIYTIHDIVPLRLPEATLDDKKQILLLLRELCAKAHHIVTVSEFSKADIIRFLKVPENRITNTYQSVHMPEAVIARSEAVVADELASAFGVEYGEYFLFVGAIEPKKNVSRLIDAFAAAGTRRPLILAGKLGWKYERELEQIGDERFLSYQNRHNGFFIHRQIRRVSYLPPSQLFSLIRGARAVLFPSLYEGFGLPVLEAMMLGTPVLTSNVSSLPEVAGDAALLVDPTDVEAIAKAIRALDQDADLRRHLGERGPKQASLFSPSAYQKRIAELYKRLGAPIDTPSGPV
jgi:glycosyltransferase involved in cell wall biosynthesis